ncbi:MAG: MlaD family protein [Steroidobacteraceae bacterium]
MSQPQHERETPGRTAAITHPTWWPGWIWAVPIAAVSIVVWLLVRSISAHGIDVTVVYSNAAGMQAGSTRVMYHGLQVGKVTSVALARDDSQIVVHLAIDRRLDDKLRSGTRFFLEGAHPSLSDLSSLVTLISGPIIIMVPGGGRPTRVFKGIEGRPRRTLAVSLPYRVTFDAAVGDLPVHSPVTLLGFTVGEVSSVGLEVDPHTGRIFTPVVLALDPTRFHILAPEPADGDWSKLFNDTLDKLVRAGLRAQLTRPLPLIGRQQVVLEMIPAAPQAQLVMLGRYPRIPTVPGGGLAAFSHKLTSLPLTQIADNIQALTAQLRRLASSPQLRDSLTRLDRTLAALERTAQQAGPQVAPTLVSLRRTAAQLRDIAAQLDTTAVVARRALGASPTAPNDNLEQTLQELGDAARAVRTLANYLDQHPEALLRGRGE